MLVKCVISSFWFAETVEYFILTVNCCLRPRSFAIYSEIAFIIFFNLFHQYLMREIFIFLSSYN